MGEWASLRFGLGAKEQGNHLSLPDIEFRTASPYSTSSPTELSRLEKMQREFSFNEKNWSEISDSFAITSELQTVCLRDEFTIAWTGKRNRR
jgi:hypothetical protein